MKMTRAIEIRDFYPLLAYALKTFDVLAFERVNFAKLDGLESMLAELLLVGVSAQRKRGLEHGYTELRDEMQFVRGSVHVLETHANRLRGSLMADCSYDEYVIDTHHNRILKASLRHSLSLKGVDPDQKVRIRGVLPFFDDVGDIARERINWAAGRYDRNNAFYRLLKHVCYMLMNGFSMSLESPQVSSLGVDIPNKPLLFQNFVANYISRHYREIEVLCEPKLSRSSRMFDPCRPTQLPELSPDIVLRYLDHTLVIDTKFYRSVLERNRFGKPILRPSHRNQIFTYVKHMSARSEGNVSGMLLYAKPEGEDEMMANFSWSELDHDFSCRTLNLNQSFHDLSSSLDELVKFHFPGVTRSM